MEILEKSLRPWRLCGRSSTTNTGTVVFQPSSSIHFHPPMPPGYTLYTPAGSFRAFAPLISAEYNHIEVTVVTEGVEEAAKSKSPTGKAPLLENHNNGSVIFASPSIARYLAGLRTDTGLVGSSFQERAAIDSWIDWCSAELELPACVLFYPIAGYMKVDAEATVKATADMKAALRVLQEHLLVGKTTYLVNDQITLADIVVASTLVYPFKLVCDETFLASFEIVARWFTTCVQSPEFQSVLGPMDICKQPTDPAK